jgi:dephospho-CoA kinase
MEPQKQIIIGLAGEIASGKDTIARYYEKRYGASMYRFSDVLRDVLKRLHLEENRRHLAQASLMLRQGFGEDVFSHAVAEEVTTDRSPLIIVDGVRRETDVKGIQNLPGFRFLFVTADPKRRFERLSQRNQNADDSTKTFEEFLSDSELESEQQIAQLKAKADFVIDNNGTLEDLYRQADFFIGKMKEGGEKNWAWNSVWGSEDKG